MYAYGVGIKLLCPIFTLKSLTWGPAGMTCGGHAGSVPDARPWHALEALLGACQGSPPLKRSPKSRLWSQDGEESGS